MAPTTFGAECRLPLTFWTKLPHVPAARFVCDSSLACRNQLRGLWAMRGQNGVFHWLEQLPLQQVSTTVCAACDKNMFSCCSKLITCNSSAGWCELFHYCCCFISQLLLLYVSWNRTNVMQELLTSLTYLSQNARTTAMIVWRKAAPHIARVTSASPDSLIKDLMEPAIVSNHELIWYKLNYNAFFTDQL